MLDKNMVFIEGIIGEAFKYERAQSGREYATFSLNVQPMSTEMADDIEQMNGQVYIRVFVFDKRVLENLKRVGAKSGQRADIFGRLTSFKNTYKNVSYVTNCLVARDMNIIQTKPQFVREQEETEIIGS